MTGRIVISSLIFGALLWVIIREIRSKANLKEGLLWFLGKKTCPKPCQSAQYTLTVIVPAYNEQDNIEKTIQSILNQTVKVERIIVVDDGSNDRTGEVAKALGVEVLTNEKNTGTKARAFNRALANVQTDLVANLDADTKLHPRAIEKALPYFTNPEVGAVCSFLYPQRIKTFWEKVRFLEYLIGLSLHKNAQFHWRAVMVASGCFSIFRTKEIQTLGGFPERSIGEDMDLTWQLSIRGRQIIYAPQAIAFPLDPQDWKTYRRQVLRWLRAWLQNLANYKLELRRAPRLMVFNIWYLFSHLVAPLAYLTILLGSIFQPVLLSFFLAELVIAGSVALPKAKKIGKFWQALSYLPLLPFIELCNTYLFYLAVYKEWIRRERLVVWEKGH